MQGFLSAERKLGGNGTGWKVSDKVSDMKSGPRQLSVHMYGCHVCTVVRTTDSKINGNGKHTLLEPAPVKEACVGF